VIVKVVPTVVALGPYMEGCFVPAINVTEVCEELPAGRDVIWVRGWSPESGAPMTAQIPATVVLLPLQPLAVSVLAA
jgi:hypothetical protein